MTELLLTETGMLNYPAICASPEDLAKQGLVHCPDCRGWGYTFDHRADPDGPHTFLVWCRRCNSLGVRRLVRRSADQ